MIVFKNLDCCYPGLGWDLSSFYRVPVDSRLCLSVTALLCRVSAAQLVKRQVEGADAFLSAGASEPSALLDCWWPLRNWYDECLH